jgi:pimeloyl-ACP methyl ester carboxylesterase
MATEQFVYFHGQPGSPDELSLVVAESLPGGLFAPDRAMDRPDLPLGPWLDHLTATVLARYPAGPIRLVGFSLGAFVALEVALRIADREVRLDLVSPAAPLGLGDFLPDMAGGAVFGLAARSPGLFGLLTGLQGGLARVAPGLLFGQIFAGAAGADADLARDPAFQATLKRILAHGLAGGAKGYRREVLGYVAWTSDRLSGLTHPVALWQGEADSWTPPTMAKALAAALPGAPALRTFPGLSHYSTLRAALPEIFAGGE